MTECQLPAQRATSQSDASRALFASVCQGDLPAFDALFDLLGPLVFGLCLHISGDADVAETATHRAFVDLWRQAPTRAARAGDGIDWICQLAHGHILAERRH